MDGEVIIYCHQRCADTYKNEAVPFVAVGSVIKSEFAVSDRILFVCAVAIAIRYFPPSSATSTAGSVTLLLRYGAIVLTAIATAHTNNILSLTANSLVYKLNKMYHVYKVCQQLK
jgi:cobalt-precorrin 5A hydrolase